MLLGALDPVEWEPTLLLDRAPGVEPLAARAAELGVAVRQVEPMPLGPQGARRLPGLREVVAARAPADLPRPPELAAGGEVAAGGGGAGPRSRRRRDRPAGPRVRARALQPAAATRALARGRPLRRRLGDDRARAGRSLPLAAGEDRGRPQRGRAGSFRSGFLAAASGARGGTAAGPHDRSAGSAEGASRTCSPPSPSCPTPSSPWPGRARREGRWKRWHPASGLPTASSSWASARTSPTCSPPATSSRCRPSTRAPRSPFSRRWRRAAPSSARAIEGTDELIEEGESGLLVAPRDSGALAAALRRLLADPGLRDRLGARARARVEADFDPQEMARRVTGIYEEELG